MVFSNKKLNIRDFLEGSHILLGRRDDEIIDELKESLNLVFKKRKIAIIEMGKHFQPYGVGYYEGNIGKINKDIVVMLEDIEKRPFLETIIMDGILNKFNLECLCILNSLIKRGIQLIMLEDSEEMILDKNKKYIRDEILKIYFNDLISRRIDNFTDKFNNK